MTVYICPEFLYDLRRHGDPNFAARVLAKAFDARGEFGPDGDDHRYKGIEDGWIRYVSASATAYRAIFLRKGEDIYWYRAGGHSVEDNLKAPKTLDDAIAVSSPPPTSDLDAQYSNARYSKSTHPKFLHQFFAARRLIAHRNITLVTPRIDTTLFAPHRLIGQLIEATREANGTFTLITKPPIAKELNQFRWIASRGVELLLHETVNARLYYFEVDAEKLDAELKHIKSTAIIGSAELTAAGLNQPAGERASEELSYEILKDDLDGALEFCLHLSDAAPDITTYFAAKAAD